MTTHAVIQTAPIPDYITEDAEILAKRPYPMLVDMGTGRIVTGDVVPSHTAVQVLGFVKDLNRQQVDVWWSAAAENLPGYVGWYAVVEDKERRSATLSTAVETVTLVDYHP